MPFQITLVLISATKSADVSSSQVSLAIVLLWVSG
jgi:hypothetical protein